MSSSKKYTPPVDFELQTGSGAKGINREAIEGKELWLLRVPDNVSAKKLDGLQIKHPKMAHKGILGETAIDNSTYQLVSSDSNVSAEFRGMAEMSVLVPDDDEESMLTLLPNQCSQLLSLVEKIDIPDSTAYAQEIATRNRPARPQPANMKMQFIPYGFFSAEEYSTMRTGDVKIALPDTSAAPGSPEPELKKRKKARQDDGDEAMCSSSPVKLGEEMDVDQKKEKKKKKDKGEKSKKEKEKKHKKTPKE
ncbi:hypothetical protein EDC05_006329 [Coemansia umbellata]|uniref:Uncharacterized protein n=1 Tax=Coemansia umbellata TaxID=1424467 RepID=A0ABQ8PF27_9FUNG|nr:hypothetical protein EDC05_006329 [Coemansia umbellata]